MKEIFKQIPTEISTTTLEYFRGKSQTLLTYIGSHLYLHNIFNPKPYMKNTRLCKKQQQQQEKLKGLFKGACDHWKYWKLQIHWSNVIFRAT